MAVFKFDSSCVVPSETEVFNYLPGGLECLKKEMYHTVRNALLPINASDILALSNNLLGNDPWRKSLGTAGLFRFIYESDFQPITRKAFSYLAVPLKMDDPLQRQDFVIPNEHIPHWEQKSSCLGNINDYLSLVLIQNYDSSLVPLSF